MKYNEEAYQGIDGPSQPFLDHDPEEEQADGDFGEHERQEGLHPVNPREFLEMSALSWREVVFMSAQAIENLQQDQNGADDSQDLSSTAVA